MIKITKTYNDFDGNERTETAYFNMTKTEFAKMAMDLSPEMRETAGNMDTIDQEAAATKVLEIMGEKGVFAFIEDLLCKAYGERSEDGRRFIKNDKLSEEFSQTILFDEIFMDLMSDDQKASDFINSLIPADMSKDTKALPKSAK